MKTTFLDINDDCIFRILNHLPAKDYMHFGQVCSRFRNVLNDYGAGLYKRLELEDTDQELLLLRQAGGHVRTLFLSLQEDRTGDMPALRVCETISGLVNLERATLKIGGLSCSYLKYIIQELEKLPKIESVGVIRGDTILTSVEHYTDSDQLLLKYKKYTDQRVLLLDMFKIGILSFGGASIENALADIVPHLTLVREVNLNLNRPPREYLPITQIPVLNTLSIFGKEACRGPLLPFLSALAAVHSRNLINLNINISHLELDEVKEIARIVSLQDLHLYHFNSSYIYPLTELRNLVRLSFPLPLENILSSQLLAVIKACPQLAVLQVSNVLSDDFIYKAFKVLQETRDPLNPKTLFLGLEHGQSQENLQETGVERYIHILSH
ncbi:uncharacterized protein LOC111071335 isoform X2 [Drosophila obscura]|uniref:uncharacterized protein LOC111071335 isoform X2 n=1 Tax=Drosophila obscura TaxID=7282 RepID=UPI001BB16965|nr:uncharacterized protein LOC111071335 isoform X2 [Drosophila obscura]